MLTNRGLNILAGAINHVRCAGSTHGVPTLAARNSNDLGSAIG
jgi:hypothetical protein